MLSERHAVASNTPNSTYLYDRRQAQIRFRYRRHSSGDGDILIRFDRPET